MCCALATRLRPAQIQQKVRSICILNNGHILRNLQASREGRQIENTMSHDRAMAASHQRIHSIDLLRGLVILLMAWDHVRDSFTAYGYDPLDLSQTDAVYFASRWITHFCAPVFVFLSGVSASLHRDAKSLGRAELARFLLTRGAWLIAIEATLISFSWSFDLDLIVFQVLFALGAGMMLLAGAVYLPRLLVAALGIAIVAGHNLLDPINAETFGSFGWIWSLLHELGYYSWRESGLFSGLFVAYPVVPWFGLMAIGYALAPWLRHSLSDNKRIVFWAGCGVTLAFLIVRGINGYGDPEPWTVQDRGAVFTFMSFLNTDKYPPSLVFLLMTMGPALMLMPWLEQWTGAAARLTRLFGRTPFFFYILHMPLIHGAAILKAQWVRSRHAGFDPGNPLTWPDWYSAPLFHSLIVWLLVLALLYPLCRWFDGYRRRKAHWWLSYL